MIDFEVFATRLKELRAQNSISQKELASKINVTYATLSSYENGSSGKIPSLEVVINIAHYFNVSVDYLLGISTKTGVNPFKRDLIELYESLINAVVNYPAELDVFVEDEIEYARVTFSDEYAIAFLKDLFKIKPLLEDDNYQDFIKQSAIDALIKKHTKVAD